MIHNFKIIKVNTDYCNYLRKFDNKVSYNEGIKDLRPFLGVLFTVGSIEYFAPLSSPKPKHQLLSNTIDLIKIDNGKYGVINLNNMIPVTKDNYEIIDLDKKPKSKSELNRQNLLRTQLRWLNKNSKDILKKAYTLYRLYKSKNLPKRIQVRCCDFILLEEKSLFYVAKNSSRIKNEICSK